MAAGLAAELREAMGLEAQMIPSKGGIFLVQVDGRTVFDKKKAQRFPILGEVSTAVMESMT